MANYSSYKKIDGSSFTSGTVSAAALNITGINNWNVKWIYGAPGACSSGCCCLWTVPTGVKRATFELWGSGGNGAGACSNGRCQHWYGSGGGYYNTKTIDVTPSDTYSICAGGLYPCYSTECNGCRGCSSYVTGTNLSNFCAIGGQQGIGIGGWDATTYSCWSCCLAPGDNGGDFGLGNHVGGQWRPKGVFCHCHGKYSIPTAAPFIGTNVMQVNNFCWIRCGCWTVPYGHGGQNGMTNYCGGCCGQGGTGGPGLVKITYV